MTTATISTASIVKTQMRLEGAIHRAVDPYAGILATPVLRQIALGAITAWLVQQDDSIDNNRLREHVAQAHSYVMKKFS